MFLNPSRLCALARAELPDDLRSHHVMDCFECGSCAYTCPSRIPLVQWIRMGKVLVKDKTRNGVCGWIMSRQVAMWTEKNPSGLFVAVWSEGVGCATGADQGVWGNIYR